MRVNAVVEFRITGRRDGGIDRYRLAFTDGRCITRRRERRKPALTLKLEPVAFLQLVGGSASPQRLLIAGKLKLRGDLMLAIALPATLRIPETAPGSRRRGSGERRGPASSAGDVDRQTPVLADGGGHVQASTEWTERAGDRDLLAPSDLGLRAPNVGASSAVWARPSATLSVSRVGRPQAREASAPAALRHATAAHPAPPADRPSAEVGHRANPPAHEN